MLDSMSLEEKVGQMFMCGFDGTVPNKEITDLIENYYISGICYFSRNLKDPKQIYELSTHLQSKVKRTLPLFLTIDQEGGMVVRVKKGVTVSPGNMALGATNNPEFVYQMANIVGHELKLMGINMNFAPSIDINNNPNNPVIGVRSFGESPSMVAKLGIEAIRGYQDSGISAVVKHFPGHGDTETDSHIGLPVVDYPLERIESVELLPFKHAIKNQVDSIMVSHVCFPAIEEKVPATLSKEMISGILRENYQYDGVVVTDCFEMKAIEENYGVENSAILAIEAGNDLVLFSHTYEKQKRAIKAVIEAVKSGRISEDRIDQSVKRIIALKKKRLLSLPVPFDETHLGTKKHLELAQQISDKSITLVKDEESLIPLNTTKKTVVIWPDIGITSDVDEQYSQQVTLGDFLNKHFEEISVSETNREELLEKVSLAENVIIATYNALTDQKQKDIINLILERYHKKTVICAFRNPYDLSAFPKASTYLAAYEIQPNALQSVAKVLTGKIIPEGKLPVTI